MNTIISLALLAILFMLPFIIIVCEAIYLQSGKLSDTERIRKQNMIQQMFIDNRNFIVTEQLKCISNRIDHIKIGLEMAEQLKDKEMIKHYQAQLDDAREDFEMIERNEAEYNEYNRKNE